METESLTPMSKWWGQISEWPHSQLFGVCPDTFGLSFSNKVNINTIISRKGQRKGNLYFKKYCTGPGDTPGGPVSKAPALDAGDLGLTPGQGTRSHMLQLKIPCVATKDPEQSKG